MAYTRRVQLWANDFCETHGSENNGNARRCPSPANGKYRYLPGLDWMRGIKAFGGFQGGNVIDPVIGGGSAGQFNRFDYFTGMPDLRWEHIHVIETDGFDRLTIIWVAETLAYDNLAVDDAAVPDGTDAYWADSIHATAHGVDVVDAYGGADALGTDFVNLPPALWPDAAASLDGEGSNSTTTVPATTNINPGSANRLVRPVPAFHHLGTGTARNRQSPVHLNSSALLVVGDNLSFPQVSEETDSLFYSRGGAYTGIPNSGFITGKGMLQYGRTYKAGTVAGSQNVYAGQRLRARWRIGQRPGLSAASSAAVSFPLNAAADLRISGIARVFFAVCSNGVAFQKLSAAAIAPEYLKSASDLTGVIPDPGAPRQIIKGRLYAVLSADSKPPFWDEMEHGRILQQFPMPGQAKRYTR